MLTPVFKIYKSEFLCDVCGHYTQMGLMNYADMCLNICDLCLIDEADQAEELPGKDNDLTGKDIPFFDTE